MASIVIIIPAGSTIFIEDQFGGLTATPTFVPKFAGTNGPYTFTTDGSIGAASLASTTPTSTASITSVLLYYGQSVGNFATPVFNIPSPTLTTFASGMTLFVPVTTSLVNTISAQSLFDALSSYDLTTSAQIAGTVSSSGRALPTGSGNRPSFWVASAHSHQILVGGVIGGVFGGLVVGLALGILIAWYWFVRRGSVAKTASTRSLDRAWLSTNSSIEHEMQLITTTK
ncbi:hypothetical protein LTR78_010226 [Recurvomyces mirabilis]|uniref:Uncharacterized protein n=1 Tax=Recurvomyces mirabilis TaxID=574656 RepID=A0AAE0TM19_9PEZI|nr:hypothetical protein LTR78_010226 [Recurvomyces mirabilis]KAK5149692.1 hypothetical protein LTS14_010753 [Recurvomyces mirabilis]